MDEKKKVIEDVDKDRRYAIDASIVRIMKSRKVLGYQQLVMECVEQLGRMFKVCFSSEYSQIFREGPVIMVSCGPYPNGLGQNWCKTLGILDPNLD